MHSCALNINDLQVLIMSMRKSYEIGFKLKVVVYFDQWQFYSPDFNVAYLRVKPRYPLYLPQTRGETHPLVRAIYEYMR